MFDEWQVFPQIWNECKIIIDEAEPSENGLVILTGSNELSLEEKRKYIKHSGLGRISQVLMRPMSLYESKDSNGKISLLSLFDPNTNIIGVTLSLTYYDIVHLTIRGGFPDSLNYSKNEEGNVSREIIDNLINDFDSDAEEFKNRTPLEKARMSAILKELARNTSSLTTYSKMLNNINSKEDFSISERTFLRYRNLLARKYLIEEIAPWSSAFKSRSNIIASPKKVFIDPSLAIAALNLTFDDLIERPIDFDIFFENLAIRDLSVYASVINGNIYHYRDRNDLEVDAVLRLNNGKYALIEIKTGGQNAIQQAGEHLLKVKNEIIKHNENLSDKSMKLSLPDALIILIGSLNTALTTKDGIHIVPIGCLKP